MALSVVLAVGIKPPMTSAPGWKTDCRAARRAGSGPDARKRNGAAHLFRAPQQVLGYIDSGEAQGRNFAWTVAASA
jgi:hypothetical protein